MYLNNAAESMNNAVKNKKNKPVIKKSKKIFIPQYQMTDEDVANVINELNEWSDISSSYSIIGFCASRGIHPRRYYNWLDKYPSLEEAHGIARAKINDRLITQGLRREIDSNIVRLMKPTFDDRDIRQASEWEAKIKEDNDKQQQVVVYLDGHKVPVIGRDNE